MPESPAAALVEPSRLLPAKSELLREVIDRQGGLDRWAATTSLKVRLRVRPTLFRSHLLSGRLRTFTVEIETRRVRAVLYPYPVEGQRGIWEGDHVRIESDSGEVVAQLSGARVDASRRWIWNDLHALYFFGYAFWNYTHTPFLFLQPGFDVTEEPKVRVQGESLRRLRVRFPPGIPTHSPEQRFYFGDDGLLRRLDYTAEIFGRWAVGAHLVEAHRSFGGLVYPTHRVVRARITRQIFVPWVRAIEGWIDGVDPIS